MRRLARGYTLLLRAPVRSPVEPEPRYPEAGQQIEPRSFDFTDYLLSGSITAVGFAADLIVVPADPFTLTPAEIHNLVVDMTIVNGHPIYERGRPAVAQSDIANLYSP